MRVIWAPLAIERAVEIAAYIATDRPDASREWVAGLFEAAKTLAQFPRRGRRVPELNRPEYRELIYGSYRVIYRVEAQRVAIVTIRHGRRLLDVTEIVEPE
ncbi:MAG: type II toxin-antitoxin system RelE/ParE family toxin [Patescibacteria group bacterium]|nr:type II toxin-antitoxin system RelE/ParE family toxin [Gemmatimonadaceae bacterium]